MAISRKLRLRLVWLLLVPFFWWARPTVELLVVGGLLAAIGLATRASAAGFIHKDRELTVTGPYAHTRNPLYLGSFLLGIGITVAGGQGVFVALFIAFFAWVYTRVIRQEAEYLAGVFGASYEAYARNVPLFLPRITPWRSGGVAPARLRFSVERWRRNREYEALLGAVAGFAALIARMVFG